MKFIKEIIDFCRFFWRTKKEDKSIIFYAEHEIYYRNFEGILDELIGKKQWTVCYVTSDPNDPVLQKSEPKIKTFYLKRLLPFFMIFVNCKVFVMTMTDLNQLHIKRSINSVHYVYVFHSPVSTHMIYLFGAFDHYDSILCVGQHHIKEIRRHEELHNLPKKELIEAGYYPLERIYTNYQEYLANQTQVKGKTTIIAAPSWGNNNILESCGERLANLLLENGYEVIIRPHPETLKRTPEMIHSLVAKYGDNPDFTLEKSVVNTDSVLKSDVLICDYSGIGLKYAFATERPVLYLDVPYKIRNEKYEELDIEPLELALRSEIGIVVSLEELDTIPQVIEKLINDKMEYKKNIRKLREQYIFALGSSSEIGATHIIDLANR
jgi:YidC/Oxa1 family membrane protein insertase